MKYLKIIGGLALIPLGVFVGSYISIAGGSGAFIGGIVGVVLWCIINWSGSWKYSLDEQHQINNNVNKEAMDNTLRGINQAHIENETRHSWDNSPMF